MVPSAEQPERGGAPKDRARPPDVSGSRVVLTARVVVAADALEFTFVSSSGPGGQHVNRRATKAQLRVRLADIPMPERAHERLVRSASHLIVGTGPDRALLIAADHSRQRERNRRLCLERLRELVKRAMVEPKRRVPTKPGRRAVQRRLDAKRRRSEIKRQRGRPDG